MGVYTPYGMQIDTCTLAGVNTGYDALDAWRNLTKEFKDYRIVNNAFTSALDQVIKIETPTFNAVDKQTHQKITVKKVVVTFLNGTSYSATQDANDVWDLKRGIEICLLQYLAGDKHTYYTGINKLVKLYENQEKEKKDAEELQKTIVRKKARSAARKKKYMEKQRQKRIEEEAEIQALAMIKVKELQDSKV